MKKSNLKTPEVSMLTKKIYVEQHKHHWQDDIMFERFYKMSVDPAYYNLTLEDFKDKIVLDAGCGNSAYLEKALIDMGVAKIYAMDLGSEWIPELKKALEYRDCDMSKIEFVEGSTTEVPFEDEKFDIVFSNGVLMVLVDEEEIEMAFKELARVTKRGGYLYTMLGNPGGLMEKKIFPAVREYYNENEEFKNLIDNITPETFLGLTNEINKYLGKMNNESLDGDLVGNLFDVDYCTYIQNVIQPPTRHIFYLSESWAKSRYMENGFEEPKQCKRYVQRKNIRKYMAPLHYDNSSVYSKILFGPGSLEYIAKKK